MSSRSSGLVGGRSAHCVALFHSGALTSDEQELIPTNLPRLADPELPVQAPKYQ